MNTMEIGQTIDMEKIATRQFSAQETILQMSKLSQTVFQRFICWGATNFVQNSNDCYDGLCKSLRFKVNGLKHKGFVYISLNFSDYYDVYYTDKKGVITGRDLNIYFEELNETIDNKIEKQDNYKF